MHSFRTKNGLSLLIDSSTDQQQSQPDSELFQGPNFTLLQRPDSPTRSPDILSPASPVSCSSTSSSSLSKVGHKSDRISKPAVRNSRGCRSRTSSLSESKVIDSPSVSSEENPVSRSSPSGQDIQSRRKRFLFQMLGNSTRRGYLSCRLCSSNIWGPNGRYHIESCTVLRQERLYAKKEGLRLHTLNGIEIDDELFAQPKLPIKKFAKIPGFVMSNTVLLGNPHKAPTLAEIRAGQTAGRKGYVRCLSCNAEVFAPNTRRHMTVCEEVS